MKVIQIELLHNCFIEIKGEFMKNKFSSIAIIALSAIAVLGVGGTAAMLLSKNGTTKTFVQETDAQIAKKKIYSVTFDGEHSQGVRGDDAVGLTAGTNGDLNDFDNCYPWNTMKDVTVGTDKYVNIDAFYFKIEEYDELVRIRDSLNKIIK